MSLRSGSKYRKSVLPTLAFNKLITVKRRRVKGKMAALTPDKVIDIVAKILPHDYSGCPLVLDNVLDKLKILQESITHEENRDLLISLIKSKLSGKARDALREEVASVKDIVTDLKNGCKGQSSWQIATSLEGMRVGNRSKYISDINDISEKLKYAYINEGTSRDAARKYVINAVTKNIRSNFSSNPVMVSAMTQEFSDINEVIHRFESIQIEKETSIMMLRNSNNNNGNNNQGGRNNHGNNNKNNNNFRRFNNNNQNNNYNNNRNHNNNRNYNNRNFNRPNNQNYNNNYNRNNWNNRTSNGNNRNIRAITVSGNEQGPDALGYSMNENSNQFPQQGRSYQITDR